MNRIVNILFVLFNYICNYSYFIMFSCCYSVILYYFFENFIDIFREILGILVNISNVKL